MREGLVTALYETAATSPGISRRGYGGRVAVASENGLNYTRHLVLSILSGFAWLLGSDIEKLREHLRGIVINKYKMEETPQQREIS